MIIWAIQILLALGVGTAGVMKLVNSKAQLENSPHMGWVRTFSETEIKRDTRNIGVLRKDENGVSLVVHAEEDSDHYEGRDRGPG